MKPQQLIFLFLFIFLIAVPLGIAAPTDSPIFSQTVSGLYLTGPEKDAYPIGEQAIMRTYLFNDSGQIQGGNATCNLRLYNSSNSLIASIELLPSGDAYLNVLNSTVMSSMGRDDYVMFCNTSTQAGFKASYFDVTVDGLPKDSAPTGLLAAIVLIPLLFGFLLMFWAHSLDAKEHSGFKIGVSLLAIMSFFMSLQFALVTVIKVYYFPALQDTISSTTYWMGWIYAVFLTYFIIYWLIKLVEGAKKKKIEKLQY